MTTAVFLRCRHTQVRLVPFLSIFFLVCVCVGEGAIFSNQSLNNMIYLKIMNSNLGKKDYPMKDTQAFAEL